MLAASGAISVLPMVGGDNDVTITVEGRPTLAFVDQLAAWYRQTTPGYFDAMGMRIVRGRGLNPRDRADSMKVVVVNETLARRFFPGEDPIGQRLKAGGPDSEEPWRTIVGIAGDVRDERDQVRDAMLAELAKPTFDHAAMLALIDQRNAQRRERIVQSAEQVHTYLMTLDPSQRESFLDMARERGFWRGLMGSGKTRR